LSCLAGAATASAARVSVQVDGFFTDARVVDRERADNKLSVKVADRAGTLIVRDRSGPLDPGPGCDGTSARRVRCELRGRRIQFLALSVKTGRGEDRLVMAGRASTDLTLPLVLISLGRGADRFFGGRSDDSVIGGPGADHADLGLGFDQFLASPHADGSDRVDGGGGLNVVGYDTRTAPVTVDLPNDIAGGAGESDALDEVRGAFGGGGEDLLLGGGGSNLLFGIEGRDRIEGGGAGDFIDGMQAVDEIFGEAGPDGIIGADGRAETLDCGAGRDSVLPDPEDALVSCEEEFVLDRSGTRGFRVPPAFERAVLESDAAPGLWRRSIRLRSQIAR
jgi:hypothetical protein